MMKENMLDCLTYVEMMYRLRHYIREYIDARAQH
jgi:hypothetical protein